MGVGREERKTVKTTLACLLASLRHWLAQTPVLGPSLLSPPVVEEGGVKVIYIYKKEERRVRVKKEKKENKDF